jgi:hypothetical protein
MTSAFDVLLGFFRIAWIMSPSIDGGEAFDLFSPDIVLKKYLSNVASWC